jgi:hypothetical protein
MGDRVKSVTKKCKGCGTEFHPRQGRLETNEWCSRQCFYKSHRVYMACQTCGKEFYYLKGKPRKHCSRKCWDGSEKHPSNFKGDKHISGKGYVYIYVPDHPYVKDHPYKRVAEHRLVMEQMLGRYLYPWELVHHKDTIKAHNDPDNLELWVTGHPNGTEVAQTYINEILELRTRITQLEADLEMRVN